MIGDRGYLQLSIIIDHFYRVKKIDSKCNYLISGKNWKNNWKKVGKKMEKVFKKYEKSRKRKWRKDGKKGVFFYLLTFCQ